MPATINMALTAPHTSLNLPMPPPKEDAIFNALSKLNPVSAQKLHNTAWAQL
jgi:hypothetical protein